MDNRGPTSALWLAAQLDTHLFAGTDNLEMENLLVDRCMCNSCH